MFILGQHGSSPAIHSAVPLTSLESVLMHLVALMELVLEFISVCCVIIGVLKTAQLAIALTKRHRRQTFFVDVRLQFGGWLALALEFQLGADILATTIAPTFETLGKLGAIALIRTFLNYFLNQELVEEYRLRDRISHSDPFGPDPES